MFDAIEEKARARYRRDCDDKGAIHQEPSGAHVDHTAETVELYNTHGTLARYDYRVDSRGRIRFDVA